MTATPSSRFSVPSRSLPALLAALAAFAFVSCNSGSDSGAGGGDRLIANADGKAFKAVPLSLAAQVNGGVPGNVLFLGTDNTGGGSRSITVTLYNVYGPGEYPLGTDMSAYGGIGQYGEGTGEGGDAKSWITESNGRAGRVVLKTIGNGRITGTFEYVSGPGKGNTLGVDRTITDGEFDLPYKGVYVPAAANKGGYVRAMLNKKSYNAATVMGSLKDYLGQAGAQVVSINSENGISLMLEGVTAKGTYAMANVSPIRTLTAGRNGGTAETCCWQSGPGASGTLIVDSISADRIKGRFSGTLKPSAGKPATADLLIEDGVFDVPVSF
jgi:hypothetical protein